MKNIILWILISLVALMMFFSGSMKVIGTEQMVTGFQKMHFPRIFLTLLGASELLGGVGLLIPKFRPYAAIGLILILPGAIAAHVVSGEPFSHAIAPIVLLVFLFAMLMLDGSITIKRGSQPLHQ